MKFRISWFQLSWDFEGLRLPREENNCGCGGYNRRTRIRSGAKDVTELLQSYNKSLRDEELLLMNEQIVVSWVGIYSWWRHHERLLKWHQSLEYDIHLVDKVVAWFENNFIVLLWVKWCQTALHAAEIICERKSQSCDKLHSTSYFKMLSPRLSATTAVVHQQPSTSRQDPLSGKSL